MHLPRPGPGCGVFATGSWRSPRPPTFTRVVNNTIFGDDGNFAYFPDPWTSRTTHRERHRHAAGKPGEPRIVRRSGSIGDTVNFRGGSAGDVDFYQFQLEIGDHVVIDVDR